MLLELHIRNFALVDELRIEFGGGLAVLTGETGAGKSIIVDALSVALGERTGSEVVRTGAEKSMVEATFDVTDNPEAAKIAAKYGFDAEDGVLILSREIARGGRSSCRINGGACTASVLREITALLIDVHGQHEHQSLLSVPLHIDILDAWIGREAADLREETRRAYDQFTSLRDERDRLQTDERERARTLDLYRFQAEEIDGARLDPGEEEELEAERNRLANAEKLYAAASEIHGVLGSGENGLADALSGAVGLGEKIAAMDPAMSRFVEGLSSALFGVEEALASIRDYRDQIEANPARLEQLEERLDTIRMLKRKYGDTIEEGLNYGREAAENVDRLANAEERSHELEGRIAELRQALESASARLTELRKKASPRFDKAVEKELAELAMDRTDFEVKLEPAELGPRGVDAVEFMISPNPGEPVKALVKIASGGEMSRIMLALKTVMARPEVRVMVFDEIDAGIGGRTAQVLGEKLARLGEKCQVMCVTHLVQIASKAHRHYAVDKHVRDGRSIVMVRQLEAEQRVTELARMLGAEGTCSSAAEHAREMLSLASNGNA